MNPLHAKAVGTFFLIAACAAWTVAWEEPEMRPNSSPQTAPKRIGSARPNTPGLPPSEWTKVSLDVDHSMAALVRKPPLPPEFVQPGEMVSIVISNVPDEDRNGICGDYRVSDTGVIKMPLIGTVRAASLLPSELAAVLQSRFLRKGIYDRPIVQVTRSISCRNSEKRVTVGGFVRQPGPISFSPQMTLWQAVQKAGGITEFGSIRRVKLYRDGHQRTLDLRKEAAMNEVLEANDTIEVPQNTPWGS